MPTFNNGSSLSHQLPERFQTFLYLIAPRQAVTQSEVILKLILRGENLTRGNSYLMPQRPFMQFVAIYIFHFNP